jgi:hypothetical protein
MKKYKEPPIDWDDHDHFDFRKCSNATFEKIATHSRSIASPEDAPRVFVEHTTEGIGRKKKDATPE